MNREGFMMNQTKAARMHPGAFRSCLIPFTDQILDWWYDDLLTAAEIQRRLKAEGLDVARTTVMRFIWRFLYHPKNETKTFTSQIRSYFLSVLTHGELTNDTLAKGRAETLPSMASPQL